jgi:RNA polymerase sigma factor (sigma-70 family)
VNYVSVSLKKELSSFPKIYANSRNLFIDESDAESLVLKGLLRAVEDYKSYRGNCKFYSYLWTVLKSEFSNYFQNATSPKRDCRKTFHLAEDAFLRKTFHLEDAKSLNEFVKVEKKVEFDQLLSKVPPTQRDWLQKLYDGYTLSKVASESGLRRGIVLDSLQKTLRRLLEP